MKLRQRKGFILRAILINFYRIKVKMRILLVEKKKYFSPMVKNIKLKAALISKKSVEKQYVLFN